MSPHCFQWLRPKRRWFQYRLRTLFVLMTLVCVWLSYNAWRFQRERAIVASILARDPQAIVVWAGPSWLRWLDENSVPAIFRRVQAVGLEADKGPAEGSELQLQNLSMLKQIAVFYPDKQESHGESEEEHRRIDALTKSLPGINVLECSSDAR